jgi:hypothetical protein
MKWFRSNIKYGTRLALFALSIQFVLAFGHFHPIAPTDTTTLPLSWSGHLALAAPNSSDHATSHQQPADDDSDRAGDVCAICAVMAMAETILLAPPPLLSPPPEAIAFFYEDRNVHPVPASSRRGFFEARAPPIS